MIGYFHVTEKIRDIAIADGNINVVTEGDIFEVDLNKQTIFPLLHIVPVDATIQPKTTVMQFSLLFMDVVDESDQDPRDTLDPFFKTSNEQDVLNATLNYANNVISEFRRGDAYDVNYTLSGDPVCTPFRQRFENLLAGWEVSFSVIVNNPAKIC